MGWIADHGAFFRAVPRTVFLGCLGGVGAALLLEILVRAWAATSIGSTVWHLAVPVHIMGVMVILFLLPGALAGGPAGPGGFSRAERALAGALSGACTALVFAVITAHISFLTTRPSHWYAGDPLMARLCIETVMGPGAGMLAAFLVISMAIQALAAAYSGTTGPWGRAPQHGLLRRHRLVILIMVAAVLVLPVAVFAGKEAGIIPGPGTLYLTNDSVDVSRIGPDTIRITMLPDPGRNRLAAGPVTEIRVFVGGVDVTSQSLIAAAGRGEIVDPPGGLQYAGGSAITIHGPAAEGDGPEPARLLVTIMYADGTSYVICDRRI